MLRLILTYAFQTGWWWAMILGRNTHTHTLGKLLQPPLPEEWVPFFRQICFYGRLSGCHGNVGSRCLTVFFLLTSISSTSFTTGWLHFLTTNKPPLPLTRVCVCLYVCMFISFEEFQINLKKNEGFLGLLSLSHSSEFESHQVSPELPSPSHYIPPETSPSGHYPGLAVCVCVRGWNTGRYCSRIICCICWSSATLTQIPAHASQRLIGHTCTDRRDITHPSHSTLPQRLGETPAASLRTTRTSQLIVWSQKS